MRKVVLALLGLCALIVAACDPVTERTYFTEGAGVDLYTADREKQVDLQRQYIGFICEQAGPTACPSGNWSVFVQAGMNDIDLRCDGFLTWLDARRRDKEPVLSEINAISTATHAIMTVTGASPQSLDIVVAAFGLASSTYTNWNSRLLISVNQSTVQTVVYSGQHDYRVKIANYAVPDQPTAIYLLRGYLRLCMPTTIEADINSTPVLVQRGDPQAVKNNPVVQPVIKRPALVVRSVPIVDNAGTLLSKYVYPNGELKPRDRDHAGEVLAFINQNSLGVSITTFLHNPDFSNQRVTLARRLKLMQ